MHKNEESVWKGSTENFKNRINLSFTEVQIVTSNYRKI